MRITQINDRVHMVTGTNVNWAIVSDGDAVTLVDSGYPNDVKALFASLEDLGHRPEDIRAVLLTHAHLDHMGGIPALRSKVNIPVLTGAEEARHARREYLEQITPAQMLAECRTGAGRRWVRQTLGAVLPHARMSLTDVTGVPVGEPLDVPGGLVAVATPGHTRGHMAWLMPSTGVLFTGDALVTDHPISRRGPGPQILPSVFNEDEAEMLASIEAWKGLPVGTIIPGHGPELRAPIDEIIRAAVGTP